MSVFRMSAEELERHQARVKGIAARECPEPPKRKYNNQPQEAGGEKYRSKKEAARHQALLRLERLGDIKNLRREVVYVLAPAVTIQGRKRPALRYVADFVYDELVNVDYRNVVEDAKGFRTEGYRIKRHLMLSQHGIEIRET